MGVKRGIVREGYREGEVKERVVKREKEGWGGLERDREDRRDGVDRRKMGWAGGRWGGQEEDGAGRSEMLPPPRQERYRVDVREMG